MYDEKNPIINTSALMLEVQLVSYLILLSANYVYYGLNAGLPSGQSSTFALDFLLLRARCCSMSVFRVINQNFSRL